MDEPPSSGRCVLSVPADEHLDTAAVSLQPTRAQRYSLVMPEDGASLAQRVRDKLDAGELPRIVPLKMWGGFGKGDPCNGCGEPIHPAQEEYEFKVHNGDVNNCRFHIGCAGLWQAELKRRGVT